MKRIASIQERVALSDVTNTTSGIGVKSSAISETQMNKRQNEIYKGESIGRYTVVKTMFCDLKRDNITGRTTDINKLQWAPKILIRKTGKMIIAAYDDSDIIPEQSLYFTYGRYEEDIYYILGLLNSRLLNYVYYHTALTNRDSIAQVKKVELDKLPIVRSAKDKVTADAIAENAAQITVLCSTDDSKSGEHERALTRRRLAAFEGTIDRLTYALFDMTTEEMRIVDSWFEGSRPKNNEL